MLLLYIAKKILYDKIYKNKSSKISHAYAHFRRFKNKKKSTSDRNTDGGIDTVCDVEAKMSQSCESGLGTMNANETESTKGYQTNDSTPHSKCTVERLPKSSGSPVWLEDGFKNMAPSNVNDAQVSPHDKQDTNVTNITTRRYSDSSSSDQERDNHRRKRRRRRKRSSQTEKIRNEQVLHQSATRGHHGYGRSNNCPTNDSRYYRHTHSKSRMEKRVPNVSYLSKEEMVSSGISDGAGETRSKSSTWRDRAYS